MKRLTCRDFFSSDKTGDFSSLFVHSEVGMPASDRSRCEQDFPLFLTFVIRKSISLAPELYSSNLHVMKVTRKFNTDIILCMLYAEITVILDSTYQVGATGIQ